MAKRSKTLTLANLSDDPQNANPGTARGRELVEASIRNYGAGRSVLADKHGRMIAGHKTVAGARAAGVKKIHVVKTTGDTLVVVQREDLDLETDAAAKELAIADNRAAEVGLEWSAERLRAIQESGADLGRTGFTAVELEAMFGAPTSADAGQAVTIPKPAEVVWILMAVPIAKWSELSQTLAPVFDQADIMVQTTRPK
jgi:hypothetical protein